MKGIWPWERFFHGVFVGAGLGLVSVSVGTVRFIQQMTGLAGIELLIALVLIVTGLALELR